MQISATLAEEMLRTPTMQHADFNFAG